MNFPSLLPAFSKLVEPSRVIEQDLGHLLYGRLVLDTACAEESVRSCSEVDESEQLGVELGLRVALEVTLRRRQVLNRPVSGLYRYEGQLS